MSFDTKSRCKGHFNESNENEGDGWQFKHISVVIIAVLSTLLVVVVLCYFCLKCKNRAKRRNSRNTCSIHRCVCSRQTQPFDNGVVTTHGIHCGSYLPPYEGSHGFARSWAYSGNQMGAVYDIPNENGVQINEQMRHQSETQSLSRTTPVVNPVYADSLDGSGRESASQTFTDGPLKDLYAVTERSCTRIVCDKMLVSIARKVGYEGGVLILDNMGISLHVPEGAVKNGESALIVLVLNWDLSDNPEMEKKESLVSPVVYVGPHGLKLDKPCTLIFRHCAFNPNQIRVMSSETELTSQKSWQALQDRESSYMTPYECHLKIETFTLYTCVQSPLDGAVGKKWLQIAVFACPLRKEVNHHQVRMYFLNKTNCALQWAIQNEANFGGKQICPEKVFLFDGNELDMFTETKYMSAGWELVDTQNSEKISFIKIWHGQCPHISVCFRRSTQQSPRTTSLAIEMSLHVFTFQRTLEENGEKIFLQVFEDEKTPFTKTEIRCNHQIDIQINNYNDTCETTRLKAKNNNAIVERPLASSGEDLSAKRLNCDESNSPDNLKFVINNNFSACSKTEHQSGVVTDGCEPRMFPHCLRKRLVLLLDPPKCPYGQDWKDLASKLGLDACIPKLQTLKDPTSELLNVLENQGKSYTEVIALFNEIGRMDCVEEMKKHLETGVIDTQSNSREPIENTCNATCEQGERNLRSEESSWTGSSHQNMDSDIWPSQFSSRQSISETYSKEISYSHN